MEKLTVHNFCSEFGADFSVTMTRGRRSLKIHVDFMLKDEHKGNRHVVFFFFEFKNEPEVTYLPRMSSGEPRNGCEDEFAVVRQLESW